MWLFDFDEDEFKVFAFVAAICLVCGVVFAIWGTATGTFAREDHEEKIKESQERARFEEIFQAPAILERDPFDYNQPKDKEAGKVRGIKVKNVLVAEASRALVARLELNELEYRPDGSWSYAERLSKVDAGKAKLEGLIETFNDHRRLACNLEFIQIFSSLCYGGMDTDFEFQDWNTRVNELRNQ